MEVHRSAGCPSSITWTSDPDEHTNLVGREPERVRDLQSHLAQWTLPPAAPRAEPRRLGNRGEIAVARIHLGFCCSSRAVYTLADDPKRLVALSETFNDALDDHSRGRADAALEKFSKVLADRPDFLAARLSAATVLIGSGRAGRRRATAARRARCRSDRDGMADEDGAGARRRPATCGKRVAVLESAVKAMRGRSGAAQRARRGAVAPRPGDEARRAFEQLLDVDPTAAGTWYNLGLLEMEARRTERGRRRVRLASSNSTRSTPMAGAVWARPLPRAIRAQRPSLATCDGARPA